MTRHLQICHTSDWHLGHTLHGHPREHEHQRFLDFLLDVLVRESVDALVVAGDVFDTANPPASAQAMLYRFLAEVRGRLPGLDVLITAGNHDSAARLSAASPILRSIGVRVVGTVPREGAGGRAPVAAGSLVVPLHDRRGDVAAWVAAVPFLRPSDLPVGEAPEGADPLVEGVRRVYGPVLDAARARRRPDQALLATGHCHMVDATPSELSERKVLGGPKHALPVDLFGPDVDYVALGHLHLAQTVAGREHVRYCGSPIPLSMPEASYPHQLRLVRFEDGALAGQSSVPIPRTVDVLRVPGDAPGELDAVLARLEALELPEAPRESRPFLEVRVRLREPVPDLRRRIEEAIGDRPVRLVKIGTEHVGGDDALAESEPRRQLGDLTVEEVFRRAWSRRYDGEPGDAVLAAFHEVAAAAKRQLEEEGA
ncbi:MAG TPA: exonuclease SbcCD subunit D C-terminal domain-containing protein [Sandaracinaceae bacterium LLY-WYZ-13_1]|nr:exonuclease SbcCD subunit D C-terminal domain-containing protein [Sandaracinaceae bacterium LLY-WYZ-13_1]